ncbi:MAG: hypothetical protein ACI95C_002533 [Pseudohongiellaceae bacterium]|jgi:hypothetical protein
MQTVDHTVRLGTASILALFLAGYVSTAHVQANEVQDISKVNSAIRIDANEHVGDVSSVNGSIRIRSGAMAADIGTVNGGIEIEDGAAIGTAGTVNGGISVGESVTVQGSLETVNGGIGVGAASDIADTISTVNGTIRLRRVHVGADVKTANGDIEIKDGSVIDGDVIIRGNSSWLSRVLSINTKPSDLLIDESSQVKGDIHLYKEVNLRIEEGAKVGRIIEHF